MTSPRRVLDEAKSPAEHVIAQAARVPPHPLRADGWDELLQRAVSRRPSSARLLPAFLLSFALGVGVVLLVQRPLAAAPNVTVAHATPETRWSSVTPDEVVLQSGRLSVTTPSTGPLRVRTPDAVIDVSRCRFLAAVVSGGTTIWVEEGVAVLRANGVTRSVRAGESLSWPPAPAIPAPLLAPPPATDSRCSTLAAAAKRDCLQLEARGNSLEAQVALYELGRLEANQGHFEAAARVWRESLARFPDGVLHPEVRLSWLIELVRTRRFAEARLAAEDFLASCPDDPRRVDVETLTRALP